MFAGRPGLGHRVLQDRSTYRLPVWLWQCRCSRSNCCTNRLGFETVENKVHLYDLHATILHLLGLDHTQLTFRYSGRDFRLTDVHGQVVHDIIA